METLFLNGGGTINFVDWNGSPTDFDRDGYLSQFPEPNKQNGMYLQARYRGVNTR